jgi:vacuolar protein sorting-associated protein 45
MTICDFPADVPKDFREVVLSPEYDRFFADNLYSDFGSVGQSLRQLVEEFQSKAKSQQKVESIEDMKSFLENYPQFKQMSGTVSKHVAVVGELARLNEKYSLLEVSELEQEISCHSNHSSSLQSLKNLIRNPKIREIDLLRLVLLYALKFESHSNNDIVGLVSKLKERGLSEENLSLVKAIIKFGGVKKRKSDLFGSDPVAVTKRFMKGLQGVENIYTQHTPWMKTITEDLLKGKLRDIQFPYYARGAGDAPDLNYRPSEVIVFILGGITYEESLVVHNINRLENRIAVVLAGTAMHNMSSFLDEVRASVRK